MIRAFAVSALVAVFAARASAQVSSREELPAELVAFVGVYELEYSHPIVVSYRLAPGGGPVLVLSDLKSDAFRALFPAGEDLFRFGHELLRPEPVAGELRFRRGDDGAVDGVVLTERGRSPAAGSRVPIETVPVWFERDGVRLEGTVFRPVNAGEELAPGIVLAHGSEAEATRFDFDALPWVGAWLGYAVLAYDKRGTGESTGSWQVSLEVLAADAVAGIELLRTCEGVDADRVGIVGVSEGGWLAPLTARMDGSVEFIVALSGGGMTKGDTFLQKHDLRFREQGLDGEALETAMAAKHAIVDASRERARNGTGNGFDQRISYDPDADWRSFGGSVLALMGGADSLQDTARCAAALEASLSLSKSNDWQVKVFPSANHGLFLAREGGTAEFQELRWSHKVPGYWPTLLRWLGERH